MMYNGCTTNAVFSSRYARYGKQTDETFIKLPALKSIGQQADAPAVCQTWHSKNGCGGFACGGYKSHAFDRLTIGGVHLPKDADCATGEALTCGGDNELALMKELCQPLPNGT
jgi:hypothetical protein